MTAPSRPRRAAQNPSARRNRPRPVVGMLTQDLLELYAEQWLGAVDGARANGSDLICFCGRALEAPGFRKQANAIYDLVSAEALDGLVIWTSVLGIIVGADRLAEFSRRFAPLPIVSVEEPLGTAPLVVMENRQGMATAVDHLIEAHDARRIAFLRGPATHAGARERYEGYRDALARHGLPEHPELVSAPPSSWLPEEAAAAVSRLLALEEPPDAIVAANDDFAVGALSALAAAGAGTRDIAVVGFDDSTNVGTHDLGFEGGKDDETAVRRTVNLSARALSLTTVRAPFRELGRRAVELVLAMIRGEPVPAVVSVPTELVVRRSCGCRPSARPGSPARPPARADLTGRLRQALTQRSARLPADWPETLCAAFVGAVRGEPAEAFLGHLDELAQRSLGDGESVENWWQVLYTLRGLIGHSAPNPRDLGRAEEVWLQAQTMLNETAERHWRYVTVLAEKRNQIVREVGHELITASDLTELAGTLADQLPRLGIPGCYLAVYGSAESAGAADTAHARLLLAYGNGVPTPIPAAGEVFESARLVPGDRLRRPAPYSLVACPVYYRDQQLGFALFELGPRIGWIYAALQEQLGSALHRAFLAERERMASEAVAEAHRREERHRLAGELHDSVSQALFSMNLHARAAELAVQQLGVDPRGRVARGLADLRELTQEALSEMRALIFQLRPDSLHDQGLVAAVRRHATAVGSREGLEVRVQAGADRLMLGERAERELFRIVQEAVHNSVKHARAGRIDIRLEVSGEAPGALVVEVADDGVGFDTDRSYPSQLGLAGMRERTGRLGGEFTMDSSASGTTVRVVLPDILPLQAATEASTTGGTAGRRGT